MSCSSFSSSSAARTPCIDPAPPRRLLRSLTLSALALAALSVSSPRAAEAHIRLLEPASWAVEDAQGNPQKAGPCGGTGVQETGAVTTFRAGQVITVAWQETVPHPGHFRISLARDRADLIDPVVQTANGDGVSGNSISADIMSPVAYPVLADNLFPRDSVPAPQPFSTTVTLPDETCENCTLQVIQFMAQHGPGYFYHHCANVNIVAADAEIPADDGATGAAGSANAGSAGAAGSASAGSAGSAGSANASAAGGSSSGRGGAAGSGAGAAQAPSSSAAGASSVADEEDSDDGGCSVSSRNPARISRAVMGVLSLVGIASLWRRRRQNRRSYDRR
jgi:Lytic polysaccharide mono-oxygenase, cellulose-degrading